MNVTRVVDVAQDLKILEHLLDIRAPINMILDVAALASRREYLNLEKWLQDNISQHGLFFMREALEFLNRKVRYELARQEQEPSTEPTTVALSAHTFAIFLRSLRMNYELLPQEEIEAFKEIRTASIQLHPKLMSFLPNNEQEPGMSVSTFDAQTEADVDAYYKRMYEEQISIEQVLNELQRAKHSESPHDHQFFACFLYGLFDEYKFFHTYPDRELGLTAALFGSLIGERLIGYVPLGIAVRYVLDAIKNPPDTNWYRFGVLALSRFQDRLADWPQLAAAVARVEHLQTTHPEVAARARAVVAGADSQTVAGPEPTDLLNGTEVEERPAFTSIRPDDAEVEGPEPEEEVSDRILFIVNNLAPSNFESKVSEMAAAIKQDNYAWFAKYLISQRVSIEPNNHSLYMQFLDALDLPPMVKHVLNETFVRCAAMLNSEKTVSSGSERTTLKNLGAWLGALTLAKDRPIRHRNVSFKDLLVEGFEKNRLIVAIPFVCKVLEQASKSRVFKPPNPWLMAILRLLVELYHFAELKLNLKFEIEVLCKALSIDLKDIDPTTTLRNRPPKDLPSTDPAVLGPETVSAQVRAQTLDGTRGSVQALSLAGGAGYVSSLQGAFLARVGITRR